MAKLSRPDLSCKIFHLLGKMQASPLSKRILSQTAGTRKKLSVYVSFHFFYLSIPLDHLSSILPVPPQICYWKPDHKWHQLKWTEVPPLFLALSPDALFLNKNVLSYSICLWKRLQAWYCYCLLVLGVLSHDFSFSKNLTKSLLQGITKSHSPSYACFNSC